jgi:hypothetical protein
MSLIKEELFKALTPENLAVLVPSLTISKVSSPAEGVSQMAVGSTDPSGLETRGWVSFPLLEPSIATVLGAALEKLHDARIPLTTLYAFDESWSVGERLRHRVEMMFGSRANRAYALVDDVWAFRVSPGQSGWPPHRGVYSLLDPKTPEYLNAWIALSDVEVDRSCMHFVPLNEDPAYRARNLDDIANVNNAVAVPLKRGEVLVWNANILHWGGACAVDARGPRLSMTFTLCREDASERSELGEARLVEKSLLEDPWCRLDSVARQILTYNTDPCVTDEAKKWAAAMLEMRELRGP